MSHGKYGAHDGDPKTAALHGIRQRVLARMGESLRAKMPKHERKPDLPMGDTPPKTPAKSVVERLAAFRKK